MATGKIDRRSVEVLKAGPTDAYLWDTELGGFGVKVTPSGRKVYLVQYEAQGGKRGMRTRRFTLGTHGNPWTPDKARRRADEILSEVTLDRDPMADRDRRRERRDWPQTVKALGERYLADRPSLRKGKTKKASSWGLDEIGIKRHIIPLLGDRALADLRPGDIERFMRQVEAGKTAQEAESEKLRGRVIVKGGRWAAARAAHSLQAMFSYAVREGWMAVNPVRAVAVPASQRRERFLNETEIADLWKALATAEAKGISRTATNIIRALMLTGARKNEIALLRWEHIDRKGQRIRLPDTKTGRADMAIAPTLAALLDEQAKTQKETPSPWVFPGQDAEQPYGGLARAWRRIVGFAGMTDLRLHDLRHTAASLLILRGLPVYSVGKVLGHRRAATTERYAHLADEAKRSAYDLLDRSMADALAPKPEGEDKGAQPVPLSAARKAKR